MASGCIFQIILLFAICFVKGTPPRCNLSLLIEYLNFKNYDHYLGLGYSNSCTSIITKITTDFDTKDIIAAVQSLHDLHHGKSNLMMHEPAVVDALQTQNVSCSFNNMYPILIGPDLNVTIIATFDNITNLFTIILAESVLNQPTQFRYFYRDQIGDPLLGPIQSFFTTIDMGRGLLHFVYQNNNHSVEAEHHVFQIKSIDSGIRITKIRSERIQFKLSQLIMDPSGNYAFYKTAGKENVYQLKVDYPKFTLNGRETPLRTAVRIFTVNDRDLILPIDRNAVVVWKFADQKRSAWLYEGSYMAGEQDGSSQFHQIGCILSGVDDPSGQLFFRIHKIRRQR